MPLSPPFRAEHIGSLMRPPALVEKRRQFAAGTIERAALTDAENAAIASATALQERVGLKFATDGEFRRASYHGYFYGKLGDISLEPPPEPPGTHAGQRGAQPLAVINSRIAWNGPIHVEDFNVLRAATSLTPKLTIPGPCALHFRGGDAAVTATAYRDTDTFWADIVAAFRSELNALAAAGCTYVQIDETAFAKFSDPSVQATLAARGDDWSALIDRYIEVTNEVLKGVNGLRIGMHLCRGNRGGQWHAEGSYESVAERLFNTLGIEFFFLEYDSSRAGDFSPLRLVPKGKTIILGLVSTKTPVLEDRNELRQRIEAASKYVAFDNLAISPQCGFSSVESGQVMTEADQEAKLRLVVDVARDVWGSA